MTVRTLAKAAWTWAAVLCAAIGLYARRAARSWLAAVSGTPVPQRARVNDDDDAHCGDQDDGGGGDVADDDDDDSGDGNDGNGVQAVPLSVNYHFTRQCNYSCGFCFHTAKTSFVLPLPEAKRGLAMLARAGMRKLNFSGGEPFIKDGGRYMGELIRYCKTELRAAGGGGGGDVSVSIVSNGSLIRESWMRRYGEHVDVLAVSCDSFDADTNRAIGRRQGARTDHVAKLYEVREWCAQHRVAFKINTVVNALNVHEDFAEHVGRLRPVRWKVFQCLLLDGENAGADALRDAARFCVTGEQFDGFLRRHRAAGVGAVMVPESNAAMRDSYLILDEYMRFLNCRNGKKEPSASLLDVGVRRALLGSGFDERAFRERGGVYVWSKHRLPEGELDW